MRAKGKVTCSKAAARSPLRSLRSPRPRRVPVGDAENDDHGIVHSVIAAIKLAKLLACAIWGARSQALFEVLFGLHKASSDGAVKEQTTEIEPLRIWTREPLAHPTTARVAANTP